MALAVNLIEPNGTPGRYTLRSIATASAQTRAPFQKRIAYAAAHVVLDVEKTRDASKEPVLDWETTLAYRRYLWSLGFRVADAMDTAQRGMGLGWQLARELIRLSAREAKACGGVVACGANTDNQPALASLEAVIAAYREECEWIESSGSQVILMASRDLARIAHSPEDYRMVYRRVLAGCDKPVILHWLGEAFDPALQGYWGSVDTAQAMSNCLELIAENRAKVDGIKISLLHAEREIEMRRKLPAGVRMYTGDDFHYPELIEGDEYGFSDALLGIFDGIAPLAAQALRTLDRGDVAGYRELLAPTVPLSRHIFEAPTYLYKTGIVFLAYLNGHQDHFRMVGAQETKRSAAHLSRLFVLADQASLFRDPERAATRFEQVLKA